MNTIFDHYYTEEFNDAGLLTKFEIDVPAEFDYAFDVCDVLAEKCPDELAMLWCNPEGERHEFTFADIKYWSDKTAAAMQEIGIGVGDRVLLILRRHYQFWFTFIACLKIGAVCIPATFLLKEHDLEYRINKANVKAVVCTQLGDIADVVDAVANKCPFLEYKLLVNGGFGGLLSKDTHQAEVPGPDEICTLPAEREGWIDFNQKILNASQDFNAYINAVHDPMLMYFTSGTSSNPKLVVHDHSYALAHTITARHWHMVQPRGLHFTIADTGWGKAVWGKLFGQWLNECAIFVYDFDRFNEAEILEQIQANKITSFCAPPTMYRMLKT
ncbi:MAG: AMP-binding protein, partial [Clostridia bacterium]|nr:AMP-binding protein [Clostridia bacterium]